MSLKEFIKYELQGWKKHEVITLLLVVTLVLFNAVFLKDSIAASISAVCGVMYSMISGKGKVSCYLFGLTGTVFYSYLSFKNALWGNLLLYAGYYFPMQTLGFILWNKNLKESNHEIKKVSIPKDELLKIACIAFILCLCVIFIIKHFNGKSPVFDGVTTVLSIVGMLFTVKRAIEQWIVWMIVNAMSALMWGFLVFNGAKAYSTLLMWIVYFILSVYFYFVWRKELVESTQKEDLQLSENKVL